MPPKTPIIADSDCLQTMVSFSASSRGNSRLAAAPPSETKADSAALTASSASPCAGAKPSASHSAAMHAAVSGQPASTLNHTLARITPASGTGSDFSSQKPRPSKLSDTLEVETVASIMQTVPAAAPYRSAPVSAMPVSAASQASARSPCQQANTVAITSKNSPNPVLNR